MIDNKDLRFENPPKSVAGIKAVILAMKKIFQVMPKRKAFKILHQLNQKEGVDCPGCAWPDPKKRSKLGEFCENGVKAIAEEAMEQVAGTAFFESHSVDALRAQSDYWLGQQGRLTHPMVLIDGASHYVPISWKLANLLIGTELRALKNPNEAVFYTSGRTSNEAAFLYQLFARMFGTNNLPDCSNMCHESSGVALSKTLGSTKGSVTLEDFDKAELILIFGQNPATNHPRMLSSLEKAKKMGAKVVSINPMKEVGLVHFKNPQTVQGILGGGVEISDLYLQVRINEDVALLKAVMYKLLKIAEIDSSILDNKFISEKTAGFAAFKTALLSHKISVLIERTGVPESEIDALTDLIANRTKIIACWGMGLTQHVNGVDNIQEVVNLLFMKGSIGKDGAGTCPVRGHSNVQGDRTMGIAERPTKALLDRISENFGFAAPREDGYSVVDAIKAMHEEKVKVFVGMGGNFSAAAPDTHFTAEALGKCNLTVHISTKLNRSHLTHGKTALILPSMGRTDKYIKNGKSQFVTVENSMGVVHSTRGVFPAPSEFVESEPVIVANIAKATLDQDTVDWDFLIEDYENIRDLIEKTIDGFENFNERVKKPLGFKLPNASRVGEFSTPNKKANFTINQMMDNPLEAEEFIMMTTRSHDQFNTTIYGLDDRYRGVFNGRMVVFMNKEDILRNNLKKGDKIALFNNYAGKERIVEGFSVVPYDLPKGCMATYFPEANPLVPLALTAHSSHTPSSKSVRVKIRFMDLSGKS